LNALISSKMRGQMGSEGRGEELKKKIEFNVSM
jgi:hypothetical protein